MLISKNIHVAENANVSIEVCNLGKTKLQSVNSNQIVIIASETEDMKKTIEIIPTTITVLEGKSISVHGKTEESLIPITDNTIITVLAPILIESLYYCKVLIKTTGVNYESSRFIINNKKGKGTIVSKTINKDFPVEYIYCNAIYDIINKPNITMNVYATSNANVETPVWEEITTNFIDKTSYKFKNTGSNIQVKIELDKTGESSFVIYRLTIIAT